MCPLGSILHAACESWLFSEHSKQPGSVLYQCRVHYSLDNISKIINKFLRVILVAGSIILEQGGSGCSMFFIARGTCQVQVNSAPVAELSEGALTCCTMGKAFRGLSCMCTHSYEIFACLLIFGTHASNFGLTRCAHKKGARDREY